MKLGCLLPLQWQYVWSSPLGLVGLLVEVLFRAFNWSQSRTGRSMVVRGPLARLMYRRGWSGTTIGWSVFYWGIPTYRTIHHEQRHVQQAMRWGVLLPFAYLACLVVQGYRGNYFERDARAYAEAQVRGKS